MFNSPFAFNGFNSSPNSQNGFSTPWNQSWNQGWNQPWNTGWNPAAAQTPSWNQSWNQGWSPSFSQSWNTPFNSFNPFWNQSSAEFSGFNGNNSFGFGGNPGFGFGSGFGFGGSNFGPSNFGPSNFAAGFNPFWNQSTPAWNWFNSPAAFFGQSPTPFGFNWWNQESNQSESNTPFNFNPFSGVTPANTNTQAA